nr:hypothetical protein [Tanacetum cinerariifolium]
MEDQPLPADASPTALSPGYVVDSDPEKDEKDPKMRRTRRRRSTQLWPTLLMYRQMILSPQAKNTKAFEIDEYASTPSTILPTPLENVMSLKDNIRV